MPLQKRRQQEGEVRYMDKPSKSGELNMADWKSAAKSALIFAGPKIVSLIAILTPQMGEIFPDPTQRMIALALITWVGDQITGLVLRYKAGK